MIYLRSDVSKWVQNHDYILDTVTFKIVTTGIQVILSLGRESSVITARLGHYPIIFKFVVKFESLPTENLTKIAKV